MTSDYFFADDNDDAQVSDIETEGGNSDGAYCMLPFLYKGASYDGCITQDRGWYT